MTVQGAIERAVLLSQGDMVDGWDLSLARIPGREPVPSGQRSLDELERDAIKDALEDPTRLLLEI